MLVSGTSKKLRLLGSIGAAAVAGLGGFTIAHVAFASSPETGTTHVLSATTTPAAPTFESETAYLDTPVPSLARAITVSSARAFSRAVRRAKAGQTINVLRNVLIPGEFKGFNRVVGGGTVNVVFQPGAGFTGNAGTQNPAVWIHDSGGWRIWGGTIVNPSGDGLQFYSLPGPFAWTGFSVGQTAGAGVDVFPTDGDISGLTLAGVVGSSSQNIEWDPHAEKGTGVQAWNIADATGGIVRDSTFAADTLNQATGAAVEIETDRISNVVLYARAKHLGFALPGTTWTGDAQEQTAGNVVQLWGGTPPGRLDIRYLEGNDIQGRLLETVGVYGGADLSQVSVDYGRATGPILQNPFCQGSPMRRSTASPSATSLPRLPGHEHREPADPSEPFEARREVVARELPVVEIAVEVRACLAADPSGPGGIAAEPVDDLDEIGEVGLAVDEMSFLLEWDGQAAGVRHRRDRGADREIVDEAETQRPQPRQVDANARAGRLGERLRVPDQPEPTPVSERPLLGEEPDGSTADLNGLVAAESAVRVDGRSPSVAQVAQVGQIPVERERV